MPPGVAPEIVAPAGVGEPPSTAAVVFAADLDPRYQFETFVIGKANEVAATAAKTLASADQVAFNPLFIHGGTGRGCGNRLLRGVLCGGATCCRDACGGTGGCGLPCTTSDGVRFLSRCENLPGGGVAAGGWRGNPSA